MFQHVLQYVVPTLDWVWFIVSMLVVLSLAARNILCTQQFSRRLDRIRFKLDKLFDDINQMLSGITGEQLERVSKLSSRERAALIKKKFPPGHKRRSLLNVVKRYGRAESSCAETKSMISKWRWLPLCDIVLSFGRHTKHALEHMQYARQALTSSKHHHHMAA